MSIQDVILISIPVSDQERAKQFYVDQLGFSLVRDDAASVPGLRWISVGAADGRVLLSLVNWFETMPAGSLRGVVLRSSDLQADYQALQAKGVEFEMAPQTRPWGTEAVFHDPDGNTFVIQQA